VRGVATAEPEQPATAPSVGREQTAWPIRGLWFVLVGWWASALWMALAWVIQLTVIGLPIALLMLNRTPFIASLYRY